MKTLMCILLFTVLFFLSCTNKSSKDITYYKNGSIQKLIIFNENQNTGKTEYFFYENGNIQSIHRFNKNGLFEGEQLWFYSNGQLDRKIPLINNKKMGNGYYFYDTTGAIKHFRYFKNDKEILYGVDYWGDSMDIMKASLHFNDSGQLFYKKNFDKDGNFISEEGHR